MRNKVVAKAVIQNAAGAILLIRRAVGDGNRPGEWDFPGGGIEPGEGVINGVAREIQEETGFVISPAELQLAYAATIPWPADQVSITRLLFVATAPDRPAVQLSFEHDAFEWVDVDTALRRFPHFFYNPGLRYIRDNQLLPVNAQ